MALGEGRIALIGCGYKTFSQATHQQNRRTRPAIDFSTDWACISHASDVLGVCVMITSALLRTETERYREEYTVSHSAGSLSVGFLVGFA